MDIHKISQRCIQRRQIETEFNTVITYEKHTKARACSKRLCTESNIEDIKKESSSRD